MRLKRSRGKRRSPTTKCAAIASHMPRRPPPPNWNLARFALYGIAMGIAWNALHPVWQRSSAQAEQHAKTIGQAIQDAKACEKADSASCTSPPHRDKQEKTDSPNAGDSKGKQPHRERQRVQ